jgi:hemoglobin-like flavoprotein
MDRHINFEVATEKFYEVLFAKLPEVEAMFGDLKYTKLMFMSVLRSIGSLEDGDRQLKEYMELLGKKHRGYGLTEQHMEIGRQAFEAAIEAGGTNLSSERKEHYLDAFTELERMMGFDVNVDGEHG